MIKWKPFEYEGETYALEHLHPKVVVYEQPAANDKPARQYKVQLIYSLHCFTRKAESDETIDQALFYRDSRECRIFDFRRYGLSKQLPMIVEAFYCRQCYHTGKGNFFVVELIGEDGVKEEYEIYFEASRSSVRGVLNLYIQSAYVRDKEHASNRPKKKPIGFYIILFKTLNNQQIKAPK
jgi:hypothetical protein